ncbi:MAG: type I-E CRISPR-associated protein Cse1/CasA [Rhodospirillaceae bacterium]|nr:type I-E CRISPR-associated protein Cse1/CasA [Rhodospirillaceae bacterium]
MNLIKDKWLPVRREDGTVERIAPCQIAETDNPAIVIESGRPDFDGSLIQFLIGLLQTASAPENHDQWIEWLETPPSPVTLQTSFLQYIEAFNLDGEEPRFMQDFDELEGSFNDISELLIEAPGGNTLKQNRDHFIKRDSVRHLCPACAATALFCLQINAPSGGAGHRTSLRGGGPLTTLVKLDSKGSELKETLWRIVWLNVFDNDVAVNLTGSHGKTNHTDMFPWLVPTRTSESSGGIETTPENANPVQMYWNMPRRIRIDWNEASSGSCDLCEETSQKLVNQYVTKNYGINYEGAWQHPLSPHNLDKKTNLFLPQHPQPGGLSYSNWLGYVAKTDWSAPAYIAELFREKRQIKKEQFRIHAFGYDMDNMKARCWYEAVFPLFHIPNNQVQDFTTRIETLIETANDIAKAVRGCIKEAWFERPVDAKGDTSFLEDVFYHRTEQSFFESVKRLLEVLSSGEDDTSILNDWHAILVKSSLGLFGDWATRSDFSQEDPRRIAKAHDNLMKKLYSKNMKTKLKLSKEKKAA